MWPQVPSSPIVVVIAGLPAVGKGTLARALSARTGIRHVDIDDNVRLPIFGLPHLDSYTDQVLMEKGRMQMGFAYDGLLQIAVRGYLTLGESIIVTATFSRALARENLKKNHCGLSECYAEGHLVCH